MINWLAVKKAAEPWEAYAEDFFRPLTEAEARSLMARRNGVPWGQALNPAMQKFYDPNTKTWTMGGVPIHQEEYMADWGPDIRWVYENGNPVKRWFNLNSEGEEIAPQYLEEYHNRRRDALTSEEADKYRLEPAEEYFTPDGTPIYIDSYHEKYRPYTQRGDPRAEGYPNFTAHLEDAALNRYKDMADMRESFGLSPEQYQTLLNKIDPNGYLKKYGLEDVEGEQASDFFKEGLRRQLLDDFLLTRSNSDYLRFLHNERPEEYETLVGEIGYNPIEQMENYKSPQEIAFEKLQKRQQRAAKRWGNSQIDLTPQQYAYYNAKQQYNQNPNDAYWNRMQQAKQPLKPIDLQNIKKYTVQQRMMNQRQPNGLPKTPAMLNAEWRDEQKRREGFVRDQYKMDNDRRNKIPTAPIPRMMNPWGEGNI